MRVMILLALLFLSGPLPALIAQGPETGRDHTADLAERLIGTWIPVTLSGEPFKDLKVELFEISFQPLPDAVERGDWTQYVRFLHPDGRREVDVKFAPYRVEGNGVILEGKATAGRFEVQFDGDRLIIDSREDKTQLVLERLP